MAEFDFATWLTNLTGKYPEFWYVLLGILVFICVRKAMVKDMKRRWPKKADRPRWLLLFLDFTDPIMKLLDWLWDKLPGDKPDIFDGDDPSSTGIRLPKTPQPPEGEKP